MKIDRYWKSVIDTLRDGLMIVDPAGTIIAMNRAAEKVTGYTAQELIGASCRVLNCTGCTIYNEGRYWCSLFADGNVKDKACLITRKDRHSLNIIKSATILYDQAGVLLGAVETLTDVSQNVRQQDEIRLLRRTCRMDRHFHGIVGNSGVMQHLFELIEQVAESKAPVLISGQSGTGKGMVARAIHESGYRKDQAYIHVNCATLNQNLLESELFGHVKGAFTGADRERIGRFEAAHRGTIFLDEVGDIPYATQTKLLRVLEENIIEKVGDHQPVEVDVRIISASNKDLEALVERGAFREDLFFRINVFPIHCPSIRHRKEDIPSLVSAFIEGSGRNGVHAAAGITPAAMKKMIAYDWPGNVREIRNAIEYATVLCGGGSIEAAHLPPHISGHSETTDGKSSADNDFVRGRREMIDALQQSGGNQSRAADILGVSRVTVWKRIKRYGIDLQQDL